MCSVFALRSVIGTPYPYNCDFGRHPRVAADFFLPTPSLSWFPS